MSANDTMAGDATITFSQGGVRPPVYVVTSISGWTTLEMDVDEEKTQTGDLVFTKDFSNVAEGRYQYKIRIGESHWVVDEAKESEMDQHGNRNNVIHVKPATHGDSSTSTTDAARAEDAVPPLSQQKDPHRLVDLRKDSSVDLDHLPQVPVPFVAVEKVADKEQPAYGDNEPVGLSTDASKPAADAEPEYEEIKADPVAETEPPKSSKLPLLVVERTDDMPAYGDDFGENATTSQKIAHGMRAADASPDKLVVAPEPHKEPGSADEQAAPLFRHESMQAEPKPSAAPLETLEEEFAQSSTDQKSTGNATEVSPELEGEGHDELNHGPLLPHETGLEVRNGASNRALAFLESESDEGDDNKFEKAPLLPHETGFANGYGPASDDDFEEDEFDKAPLLSHETDFSDHKGSEIRTNSDDLGVNENLEPQHYGPYGDDDDDDDYIENGDNDAPLLPHERDSAIASNAGSDDGRFSLREQPTFGYETDNAKELFGGSGRANIFRTRTNSSMLPHRLPQSDAEDENLHDPSLERFPISREQILERVATIGLHLPEDDVLEDHHHSPPLSVFSQACSSVDLVPVKSYTSLASVPEAEFSDEEDDDDDDVDSLPSPVFIGASSTRASNAPFGFAHDPNATPLPDNSKQLGYIAEDQAEAQEDKPQVQSNHTTESSEAESVSKHDGTKDISGVLRSLGAAVATPARMVSPMTPPLTPEHKTTTKDDKTLSSSDSQLRERRKRVEGSIIEAEDAPVAAIPAESDTKDKSSSAVELASAHQSSRFLTACVGDRKRASASVMVLGALAAACYYLASAS